MSSPLALHCGCYADNYDGDDNKSHFHNDEYGDDEDPDGEGGDDENNDSWQHHNAALVRHLDLKIKYSTFRVRFDKNAAQRKINFCVKTWSGVLTWNVRFFRGGKTIPILFQYFLLANRFNILYVECLLLVIMMIKNKTIKMEVSPKTLGWFKHTSYLSFFLHRQKFWRIKFTPKLTQ